MLNKSATARLGSPEAGGVAALKRHPFFRLPASYPLAAGARLALPPGAAAEGAWVALDWDLVLSRAYVPLYCPDADLSVGHGPLAHFDAGFTTLPLASLRAAIEPTALAQRRSMAARSIVSGSLSHFSFSAPVSAMPAAAAALAAGGVGAGTGTGAVGGGSGGGAGGALPSVEEGPGARASRASSGSGRSGSSDASSFFDYEEEGYEIDYSAAGQSGGNER